MLPKQTKRLINHSPDCCLGGHIGNIRGVVGWPTELSVRRDRFGSSAIRLATGIHAPFMCPSQDHLHRVLRPFAVFRLCRVVARSFATFRKMSLVSLRFTSLRRRALYIDARHIKAIMIYSLIAIVSDLVERCQRGRSTDKYKLSSGVRVVDGPLQDLFNLCRKVINTSVVRHRRGGIVYARLHDAYRHLGVGHLDKSASVKG